MGIVQTQGSRKAAPSGGRKFVQTSAEDKLVWTMPSAAEFGETQEIIFDDFTGDKTMASVSLQSRLTLNSRLSIKKPAHKARVSVGNERCEVSQKRRYQRRRPLIVGTANGNK